MKTKRKNKLNLNSTPPHPEFDLKAYLQRNAKLIDDALDDLIEHSLSENELIEIIKYCSMNGGKRIRPILCIAAAEAVGGDVQDVLEAACALEMIHTYSIIHDDLPAMDDDDVRRGRPSCHVAFGESTAILAGDALLTLAFETLSRPTPAKEKHAAVWLKLMHIVAMRVGCRGMVEGQYLDITSEGKRLELRELERIYRLKTGALIEASVYSGALLGGADDGQTAALVDYAQKIGLVFQIIDDILNVEGDSEVTGKAVGSDQVRGKSTYPSLMGLESSRRLARKLSDDALNSIVDFDRKAEPLRAIAQFLARRRK